MGKLSEGDAAVRSSLVEHNLRLVVYIARKFDNTGADADDLVSVGTIGLIKAVNSFDPSKKYQVGHIRLALHRKRDPHVPAPPRTGAQRGLLRRASQYRLGGERTAPLDILGTDSDVVYKDIETGVEKELLRGALRKLPERDRRIMTMRFGLDGKEEMTQKDVADVLGISQSYISRLEKKIIARLKSEIGKLV